MNKCNLCKKSVADKKGSHIVPHFLLKRIENIEGEKGRDYEIGYKIEKFKAKSHFGRSVQPEKLEMTYGKITDNDLANNSHPLIVDNFLCSKCEERFALVEREYSETIETVKETDYESGINNIYGILFWTSIYWRMSVHGKMGAKLTEEQNEFMRVILDSFLSTKNQVLNEKEFKNSDLVKGISYKIIRCHNAKEGDAKLLLFHPEFCNSFCLFIDEFVVVFSLDGNYEEFETTDCFGINGLIQKAPVNSSNGNEIIQPFDRTIFLEYAKRIMNKIKNVYVDGLDEFFDKVHIAAGGKGDKMPIELKQEIMAEITSDEKKIGRKYTHEEIVESAYKVLNKKSPYYHV